MQQILSIALIAVFAIAAYITPAKAAAHAHNAASTCNVTSRAGGKRIFVTHVKDGAELFYSIDGVQQRRIFRGPTATGSDGAITVKDANGTQICSG